MIEALPEILALGDGAPQEAVPRSLPLDLPDMGRRQRAIDRALDDDFLTHLPAIDDAELRQIETGLSSTEDTISTQRRAVHDALEVILAELTRRYRDGSATVDELLQQS